MVAEKQAETIPEFNPHLRRDMFYAANKAALWTLAGETVLVPDPDNLDGLTREALNPISHWSHMTDADVPRLGVLTDSFFRFIDEGEDASVLTVWRDGVPIVRQIDGDTCDAAVELVSSAIVSDQPLREKWHGLPPLEAEIEHLAYRHGFGAGHRPLWLERKARENLIARDIDPDGPTDVAPRVPPVAANDNLATKPIELPKKSKQLSATAWRLPDPQAIPPREWLYGRQYIRKFVTLTVSPGGVGKTSLGMVEALCMATGRELLGEHVHKRSKVWLWNGEDPQEELDRRLAAACIYHGISGDEINGRLFVDSGRDSPIITATQTKDGTKIAVPVVERICEEILAKGIDVMIIDPFVSSHAVTENDNMAMDAVVKQAWATIADRTNCSIDLVHHAKKMGGQEVTAESARGGVALIGAARAARVLNPMSAEEANTANVEGRHAYFRVTDAKANLAPRSDKSSWFKMVGHVLGNATPDRPSDNVGVVTAWKWPSAMDGVHVSDLLAVQKAIHAGSFKDSSQAANWAGYAVAEVMGLDIADAKDKAKATALLKVWKRSGALIVERKEDAQRKVTPHVVVGEWAINE